MTLRERLLALADKYGAEGLDPRDMVLAAARMALEDATERKYPCWPLDGRQTLTDTIDAIRTLREWLE